MCRPGPSSIYRVNEPRLASQCYIRRLISLTSLCYNSSSRVVVLRHVPCLFLVVNLYSRVFPICCSKNTRIEYNFRIWCNYKCSSPSPMFPCGGLGETVRFKFFRSVQRRGRIFGNFPNILGFDIWLCRKGGFCQFLESHLLSGFCSNGSLLAAISV